MFMTMLIMSFVGAAAIVVYLMAPNEAEAAAHRRLYNLRTRPARAARLEEEELRVPFVRRVIDPMLEKVYALLAKITPAGLKERTNRRLNEAGRPLSLGKFMALKIYLGLAVAILAAAASHPLLAAGAGVPAVLLVIVPVTLAVGVLGPDLWLSNIGSTRRKKMARALPDVLDLLSVSVEAGLGFDGAMQKVSEKFPDPVSVEFGSYLKEVRLGQGRQDALRNLAERTQVPELKTFSAAVIQAERLGVSMSRVLRVQSDQMRFLRKQRAEENAMKAPLKMLFPLALFIFPTLFIILLGPVVLHFMAIFG